MVPFFKTLVAWAYWTVEVLAPENSKRHVKAVCAWCCQYLGLHVFIQTPVEFDCAQHPTVSVHQEDKTGMKPVGLARLRGGLTGLAKVYKRRIAAGAYPEDGETTREMKLANVEKLVAAGYPCTVDDSWEVIYKLTVKHLDKISALGEKKVD